MYTASQRPDDLVGVGRGGWCNAGVGAVDASVLNIFFGIIYIYFQ
jgi:hypothetical protein